jgi:channel protein (hemolysin III family)
LHGVAAGLALVGAVQLTAEATSTAGRLGVLAFGAGMTALFLTSSLYHSMPWSPAAMSDAAHATP